MKETLEFIRIVDHVSRAIDRLPNRIAAEAVRFSKDRFRAQNWIDNTTEPWKKRKVNKGSRQRQRRGILIDKARLFRSIRKVYASAQVVIIGTDVEYAQAHNDGLRIRTTQSVNQYTRKAHSRTREGRKEIVSAHIVSAHKRDINFKMPRRRFIGPSAVLNTKIVRLITADISTAIKTA